MKAGPSCSSPAVVNPAAWRAAYPVVRVASHPRTMLPPEGEKSTTTITPALVVQLPMGSAPAAVGRDRRPGPIPPADGGGDDARGHHAADVQPRRCRVYVPWSAGRMRNHAPLRCGADARPPVRSSVPRPSSRGTWRRRRRRCRRRSPPPSSPCRPGWGPCPRRAGSGGVPPIEPWNVASPKAKMPPSAGHLPVALAVGGRGHAHHRPVQVASRPSSRGTSASPKAKMPPSAGHLPVARRRRGWGPCPPPAG